MANFKGPASSGPHGDQRLARTLLGCYLPFLLYGSLFPFHFAVSQAVLRDRLGEAVILPWNSQGDRIFSIPDVISNVLLGAPFGLLLIGSGLVGSSLSGRIIRILVLDAILAGSLEIGQLFVPGRTTSLLDVFGQVAGSLAGGIFAHALFHAREGSLGPWIVSRLRRRPALGPLALLVGVLAANALYPYTPTLDVASLRASVKAAVWIPLEEPWRVSWQALIVERALPYTLLAVLLASGFGGAPVARSRRRAVGLGTALSVGLELGRLFIEGRAPNADHVLVAITGLLAGLLVVPAERWFRPSLLRRILLVGASGVIAYEELAPFGLVWSLAHLQAKVAHVEWVPFATYYWASLQSGLFDAGKKLLVGGLFGSALWAAGYRRVLPLTLLAAGLLEFVQLLAPSRHPSVGDVLLLGAGAVAGRVVSSRYLRLTCSRHGAEAGMLDSRSDANGRGTQPRNGCSA